MRRTTRSVMATVCLTITVTAVATGVAGAVALTDADAAELQQLLGEAQSVQDTCYSYSVQVVDNDGAESTREVGHSWTPRVERPPSSRSAGYIDQLGGVDPPPGACSRWVTLDIRTTYTAASSSNEDSASSTVGVIDVPGRTPDDDLGSKLQGDLAIGTRSIIDDPGGTAFDAMRSLPGLVAATGAAPYLPLEVNTEPLGPDETLDGGGGSDLWRNNGDRIIVFGLGLVAAIAWIAYIVIGHRRQSSQRASGDFDEGRHADLRRDVVRSRRERDVQHNETEEPRR